MSLARAVAIYAPRLLLMKCLFWLITLISSLIGTNAAISQCPSPRRPTPNIVASKEDAELKVLVPNILSFRQFVNCSDPAHVHGFCIDVFEMALSILTPTSTYSPHMSINYTCFDFPSIPSASGPTYTDMVERVANGEFDIVVGDVTIGAERLSRVDFTQKYIESGVVILTNVALDRVPTWLLLGWPFSLGMWSTIVGAFIFTGCLVCYLERNDHPEFTQGHIAHRMGNVLWFSAEALVLLEREPLKSNVARWVILAWLLFAVLMGASYTAALSSLLTATNLSPTSPNLLSLKDSGKSIGYRRGSIVKEYLTANFNIPEERLVPMRMTSEFIGNLTRGVVVAIVDELPYANLILSSLSSPTCDFGIAGPELTQEGFGFGFNKERGLEAAFSIAITNLTECGRLQELQSKFGLTRGANKCSESALPSTKLTWKSSLLLFSPLLGSLSICIIVHYVKNYAWSKQYIRALEGPRPTVDDDMLAVYHGITQRHHFEHIELQRYP